MGHTHLLALSYESASCQRLEERRLRGMHQRLWDEYSTQTAADAHAKSPRRIQAVGPGGRKPVGSIAWVINLARSSLPNGVYDGIVVAPCFASYLQ